MSISKRPSLDDVLHCPTFDYLVPTRHGIKGNDRLAANQLTAKSRKDVLRSSGSLSSSYSVSDRCLRGWGLNHRGNVDLNLILTGVKLVCKIPPEGLLRRVGSRPERHLDW